MHVVVILNNRSANHVVAVIENPDGAMSTGAVALAWAKSEGYEKFPKDCTFHAANLISYGSVARRLTPVHELEQLEKDGERTTLESLYRE